ncbi:Heterogeneous nuclear ribonucleoprotein H2, partial [Geodia barretti]
MPIVAGGVTMQVDAENRGTGEAYVEFVRPDDAEKALYKNRQMMGHRYIEVFRSTHTEVRPTNMKETRWRGTPYSRPPPQGQWGGGGGDRGGYGGYGGYGAGGYGGKFGGGYDRGGRGRGRGMMRGGGGGYNNYGDAGGGPGYTPYP